MPIKIDYSEHLKPGEIFKDPDPDFCKALAAEHFWHLPEGAPKILAATLPLQEINHRPYKTHLQTFQHTGAHWDKLRVVIFLVHRSEIARARNNAVRTAIRGNFDYLFFWDDDTEMPQRIFLQLLKRMKEFNSVSGSYYLRGYPFQPMVFRWAGKNRKYMKLVSWRSYRKFIEPDGVMRNQVSALGCGCTMYRVEDFKKVTYPWFQATPHLTEDAFWFLQAHKNIKDYKVGMDFNLDCGHLCDPIAVNQNNVDILRRMYREIYKKNGGNYNE